MFQAVWNLFGLPIYGTMQWADKTTFASAFKHPIQEFCHIQPKSC
jgi:hypothetical protein